MQRYTEKFIESLEEQSSTTNPLPDSLDPNTTTLSEYAIAFCAVSSHLLSLASMGNKLEKKLALHLDGYQARSKTLRKKIVETGETVDGARIALDSFRTLQLGEEAALTRRSRQSGQ